MPGTSHLVENVISHAWKAILEGELVPGESVTEERLCELCGASRTPVREAIRNLEAAGVLVREVNRRLRIATLSIDEMEQVSSIREVLEGLMAQSAAERVGAGLEDTSELRSLLMQMAAMENADEMEALLQLGDRFHRRIWEMAHNPPGQQILEQIMLGFERYRHLIHRNRARQASLVSDHEMILERIAAKDGIGAEVAARNHIRKAREIYRPILERLIATGRNAADRGQTAHISKTMGSE